MERTLYFKLYGAKESILQRAVEWWLREGMYGFPYGAPEWVFAAREALTKCPRTIKVGVPGEPMPADVYRTPIGQETYLSSPYLAGYSSGDLAIPSGGRLEITAAEDVS